MQKQFTRRDFLKAGGLLAAGFGLSGGMGRVFAAGLEKLAGGQMRVLWLQGQSCSGCSVSLLNSESPRPETVLTEVISLIFHSTISAAQGHLFDEILATAQREGDFILAVEGSIPAGMPRACVIAGKPLTDILPPLMRRARGVAAVGTCAAFGGIPAAEGNSTGAIDVATFMKNQGIKTPLINLPSCPAHPKSMVGTLAYLAAKGIPPLDPTFNTPTVFYGQRLHDECPRFHYWEKYHFAEHFGEAEGCLFKLGCLGPLSYTQCSNRQWNGGVNWCVRAGSPCIGCSSPEFARRRDFPFYRKGERTHAVPYNESDRGETRS